MKDKDDKLFLLHIRDAINLIEEFIESKDFESFLNNKILKSAVVYHFQIIGEATKKLSPELINEYSEINWKDIAGMRDKIVHSYFDVDYVLVWRVIKQDLPALKSTVNTILEDLEEE